jgi:hypothetical protein
VANFQSCGSTPWFWKDCELRDGYAITAVALNCNISQSKQRENGPFHSTDSSLRLRARLTLLFRRRRLGDLECVGSAKDDHATLRTSKGAVLIFKLEKEERALDRHNIVCLKANCVNRIICQCTLGEVRPPLSLTCHWSYPIKPTWSSPLKSFFKGTVCPKPHSVANVCPGVALVPCPVVLLP